MEKIYKFKHSLIGWLPGVVAMIALLSFFVYVLPIPFKPVFYTIIILGVLVYIVQREIFLRKIYLKLKNNNLVLAEKQTIKWSLPVSSISEMDGTQGHLRQKGTWGAYGGTAFNHQIAFLIISDGKEFEIENFIEKPEELLNDLKNINANIIFANTTEKSEKEYKTRIIEAEKRNEYTPDNPASKYFGKWLSPKVITYGAITILVALIVLFIYAMVKNS